MRFKKKFRSINNRKWKRIFLYFYGFRENIFQIPLEPAWTSSIVWMPLGPNENFI